MMAVDTNIVVRYLVKDDREQARNATDFLAKERCFLLRSVLIEVVWVLSSPFGYALQRQTVLERLLHLLGLPSVETEAAPSVAQALEWYRSGMDFADAIHLASSAEHSGFATLDKGLASKAKKLKAVPAVVLLR